MRTLRLERPRDTARVAPSPPRPYRNRRRTVCAKPGVVRALGDDGGRASEPPAPVTRPWRQAEMSRRCERMSCHVISTLWPRPPRRQNGAAGVEIRCGDSVSRSVLWLGRIACRMQTAGLCACVCVRVRACVCARRRRRGRGATMPQVAGRQASPPLSLRQRAFEILLGLVL